jgi:hypothetical protein
VEAFAFERNQGFLNDSLHGARCARCANRDGIICNALFQFEHDLTALAFINVDWHLQEAIVALSGFRNHA